MLSLASAGATAWSLSCAWRTTLTALSSRRCASMHASKHTVKPGASRPRLHRPCLEPKATQSSSSGVALRSKPEVEHSSQETVHRSDDVGAHAANAPPAIRTVASLHVLHSKGAETTFRPSIQSVSTHDVAIVASHQRRRVGHAARESAEPVRLQRADTPARNGTSR